MRRSLHLVIWLLGIFDLNGILFIAAYSTEMVERAGIGHIDAAWATVLIQFIRILFAPLLPYLIYRYTRRTLSQIPLFQLGICHIFLMIVYWFFHKSIISAVMVITVVTVIYLLFIIAHTANYAAVIEVCTQQMRAVSLTVGRCVGWLIGGVLTYSYLPLSDKYGEQWIYGFCGVCSFLITAFLYAKMPERKNKTFQQISNELGGEEEEHLLQEDEAGDI